ncbi:MAG: maleylpyruvate isomerase family mycothiol-dependent enzyme [Haloechinothrix sp.]
MSEQVLIDYGRMLDRLTLEADLLVEASHHAPYDTRVPACPGLTIGEVVRHLGSVYRLVVSWLGDGRRPQEWQRDPAPGQSAEQYLLAGFDDLIRELASRDPSAPAGTWWPADQTARFWRRRMLHETTVHRADVQSAAGLARTEIPADIAIDGIDEALTLWFGHRLDVLGVSGTRECSVAVRTEGHAWLARAGPGHTEAQRSSRLNDVVADAEVTGAPDRVYLWLWGRLATHEVTTDGDDDAVAQLWALLRLATR